MARLKVTLDELNTFLDATELLFAQQQKGNWNKKLLVLLPSTPTGVRQVLYEVSECGIIKLETYNKLVALNFYNDLDNAKS